METNKTTEKRKKHKKNKNKNKTLPTAPKQHKRKLRIKE